MEDEGRVGGSSKPPVETPSRASTGVSNVGGFKEYNPTPEDAKVFKTWAKTGPKDVSGMVKAGNIDLTKRPLVHNADGSVSSLLSMSFGTDDGEVLVPKVSPDGRILTNKEAMDRYRKTGETLGIFKTVEAADAYADLIHKKQGAFQTWTNGGSYNPTVEK